MYKYSYETSTLMLTLVHCTQIKSSTILLTLTLQMVLPAGFVRVSSNYIADVDFSSNMLLRVYAFLRCSRAVQWDFQGLPVESQHTGVIILQQQQWHVTCSLRAMLRADPEFTAKLTAACQKQIFPDALMGAAPVQARPSNMSFPKSARLI